MKAQTIAVIGSGTSGLAAAAFLHRDRHDVTLFEKFSTPQPLGAGLLLQPTGLACLSALGLGAQVLAAGARIDHLDGRTVKGRRIFDIHYRDLAPHLFGLGIHRGALFSILYQEVLRLGMRIVTDCDIAATNCIGDKREIVDATGQSRGVFDLVIDASGARSALRGRYGQVKLNKPYPYGAVWGVCEDAGQGFSRDCLQQRYEGAGVMIGALAIGQRPQDGKQTLAFFWSLPTDTYPAWRAGDFAGWQQRVTDYWPDMAPFVAQFRTPDDLTFAQYSDVIMRQWHDDRLVFIGDAAHCTSPQLGQGANLGLVDALTLAEVLRDAPDLAAALPRYTATRRNHTLFYQRASRWLTPFFQSGSVPAARVRDATFNLMCQTPYVRTQMLRTLAGLKDGLFTHINPGAWHTDYDVRRK